MAKATQKGRLLGIDTPLGEDYLLLNKLHAEEKISELFEVDVELLYDEDTNDGYQITLVDGKDIVGQRVNIVIALDDLEKKTTERRSIIGMVNHFTMVGRERRFTIYRAKIVPHVWKLTLNSQSRIFQQKTVPDILREVFDGFEVEFQLKADYKQRNYCTQYQETDFDFASRLMEEEGIYYYFQHSGTTEKMILRDDFSKPEDCPIKSDFPIFNEDLKSGEYFESAIKSWLMVYKLQSGKVTLWDYNFQLPKNKLKDELTSLFDVGGNKKLEVYTFQAGYARKYDGIDKGGGEQPNELNNVFSDIKRTVANRMPMHDSQYKTATGMSDCCTLTPGYRFQLKNHPNKEFNIKHIVLSVVHDAQQNPNYQAGEVPDAYVNEFTCIPHGSEQPEFRPQLKTPKPIIHGSQTAVVVGPGGEEIFTDKYGRVKVQFHWDRDGTYDPSSSCWLRIATSIAGNKWGTMFIPRIGQEVLVDFLEGNPDQPIIVGSVYNPETMPHYDLPKYKTLSYIKTRTTPDDGKGFNELRFEDKQGKEQVFIHSQKRMDTRVRESFYETCGANRQEVIGVRTDNKPGGNLAITVGGNYDLHVKESMYIGIDGKLNEYVKGEVVEDYQNTLQTTVKSSAELNAGSITLEAKTTITLKVGGNFVMIDPSGITISGLTVRINSGGAAIGTSQAMIDDPLDAEPADTGEPGYLDRPRTGGGKGRNRRFLNGQHAPDVSRLNSLINESKQLKAEGKDAESAAKKQEAINEAIDVYNIDTSNAKSVKYDPTVSGEGLSSSDGTVTIGDDAFKDPAWLGSSIGHESEAHVNKQGAQGKWYTGPEGTAIQEVQAYDYEIANADRYGTSPENLAELKRRRNAYYNQLSDQYKQRVNGNPPNYDMKPGDENK